MRLQLPVPLINRAQTPKQEIGQGDRRQLYQPANEVPVGTWSQTCRDTVNADIVKHDRQIGTWNPQELRIKWQPNFGADYGQKH